MNNLSNEVFNYTIRYMTNTDVDNLRIAFIQFICSHIRRPVLIRNKNVNITHDICRKF